MTEEDVPREKAYRPIGEVADLLRLQPHVLRFWETKFSQIQPLKRQGGRRYYRSQDVRLLFKIRDLLYVERYTLQGVQNLLARSAKSPSMERSSPPSPDPQIPDPRVRTKLEQLRNRLQEAVQEAQQQDSR